MEQYEALLVRRGYSLHGAQYCSMREAFLNAEAEHRAVELQWTHTREHIAALINVNKGKRGRRVKGEDVIKLDMDEEGKVERAHESLERLKYWEKVLKNGGFTSKG